MFLGLSLVLAKSIALLFEYSRLCGVLAGLKGVLIIGIFWYWQEPSSQTQFFSSHKFAAKFQLLPVEELPNVEYRVIIIRIKLVGLFTAGAQLDRIFRSFENWNDWGKGLPSDTMRLPLPCLFALFKSFLVCSPRLLTLVPTCSVLSDEDFGPKPGSFLDQRCFVIGIPVFPSYSRILVLQEIKLWAS